MADSRTGPVGWYSPDPRAILPLSSFNIPHGMRRVLRKNPFDVRVDTAFMQVVRACAERRETWINDEIIDVYGELFALGHAHSVESWEAGTLVGGLYGVVLGGAFFGESMFSHRSEASKVALVALVSALRARAFTLLDVQFVNEHLQQFGVQTVPRDRYLELLAAAVTVDTTFPGPGTLLA
jgi:leucyl/phenylalanyl-tRNA--protein transferase